MKVSLKILHSTIFIGFLTASMIGFYAYGYINGLNESYKITNENTVIDYKMRRAYTKVQETIVM